MYINKTEKTVLYKHPIQLNTWFLDCLLPFWNKQFHCISASPEWNQPADDIHKIYPSIRDINIIFHLPAKKFFLKNNLSLPPSQEDMHCQVQGENWELIIEKNPNNYDPNRGPNC